jgi:hypothetical protein
MIPLFVTFSGCYHFRSRYNSKSCHCIDGRDENSHECSHRVHGEFVTSQCRNHHPVPPRRKQQQVGTVTNQQRRCWHDGGCQGRVLAMIGRRQGGTGTHESEACSGPGQKGSFGCKNVSSQRASIGYFFSGRRPKETRIIALMRMLVLLFLSSKRYVIPLPPPFRETSTSRVGSHSNRLHVGCEELITTDSAIDTFCSICMVSAQRVREPRGSMPPSSPRAATEKYATYLHQS